MNILRDDKGESIINVSIENWGKVNMKLIRVKEAKVLENQKVVLVSPMKSEINIKWYQA